MGGRHVREESDDNFELAPCSNVDELEDIKM